MQELDDIFSDAFLDPEGALFEQLLFEVASLGGVFVGRFLELFDFLEVGLECSEECGEKDGCLDEGFLLWGRGRRGLVGGRDAFGFFEACAICEGVEHGVAKRVLVEFTGLEKIPGDLDFGDP